MSFLNEINTPSLSLENKNICDTELTLKDLSDSLTSMTSGKSPGNDGLTIEFYKHFWNDLKTHSITLHYIKNSWFIVCFSKTGNNQTFREKR